MLHFPSPITHENTRRGALIFALLAGGSLLLMKREAPPTAVIVEPSAPAVVQPKAPAVTVALAQEISLQESLDRLGYTVNVPASVISDPSFDGYRTSTHSDALQAGRFRINGAVSLRKIGQQAWLATDSTFGMIADGGYDYPMIQPGDTRSLWLDSTTTTTYQREMTGTVRFYLNHPDAQMLGSLATRSLYSTAADNPTHRSQLLVIPARVGGNWVGEGGNRGHWEGGADTGDYLLCWDDLPNGPQDFQDMIVLARGITPVP